jgi:hypothetical protein
MKTLLTFALLTFASVSFAARVECAAGDYKISISSSSPSDIKVTFRGETVKADGIFDANEIDLVARFSSIGEIVIFAKVGQGSPENYLFIQGKRNAVVCR